MSAKETIPEVYVAGAARGVHLLLGYYLLKDGTWFLVNPSSDAGVQVSQDGKHINYWQGNEDASALNQLTEAGLDPRHVKFE